jgi:endonuclease/exonuclease/phosphatase family metal-dependent hydrolase
MKLITLNIWGGRVSAKLEPFFKERSETDIFCFQEVYDKGPATIEHGLMFDQFEHNPNLLDALKSYLPKHTAKFCQTLQDTYGIAMFLKPGVEILHHGELLVARGDWEHNTDIETKDHHRKVQWIELLIKGKRVLVANAHLTHRPKGKQDSPKRIKQSQTIINFLEMFECPKILVGDFNLMPDTQSITMFEDAHMKNLVKEYGVTSTRTELYRGYKNGPKFADYIFVSKDVKVNDFKVLPDIVSDHSPLYLDFDL